VTPEELRALIAGGESLTVEFKSDQGPLSDADLIETVALKQLVQAGWLQLIRPRPRRSLRTGRARRNSEKRAPELRIRSLAGDCEMAHCEIALPPTGARPLKKRWWN